MNVSWSDADLASATRCGPSSTPSWRPSFARSARPWPPSTPSTSPRRPGRRSSSGRQAPERPARSMPAPTRSSGTSSPMAPWIS